MSIIGTYLLEFDERIGPVLIKQPKDSILTESQIKILKLNCFPESTTPLKQGVTSFCFKLEKYFCYSAFVSIPNSSFKRNFQQFSIVIVTSFPYYPLFMNLMESITIVVSMDPKTIYSLIENFVGKWESHLCSLPSSNFELPLFNGSISIIPNSSTKNLLTSNENAYRANDRFIDHDIKNVLNTNFNEISKLWEYIITEQPVMIYGKTPNLVTHGSFAAASLCYPEDPCEVIPYISLTDPRFPNLSKSKSCVFGTSNPASLLAVSKTVHVHKIEYENSINGEKLTSAQIRCKLYCNTRRIRKALEKAIDRQIQINFLSVIIGKISSSLIEKSLTEERFIPQTVSLQRFSRLLARSNLCEKIRRERLLTQNALAQYLSLRIPEKLKLSALRKVYISFVNALEIGSMTEANEIVLQNKIREIAPLLHSQL